MKYPIKIRDQVLGDITVLFNTPKPTSTMMKQAIAKYQATPEYKALRKESGIDKVAASETVYNQFAKLYSNPFEGTIASEGRDIDPLKERSMIFPSVTKDQHPVKKTLLGAMDLLDFPARAVAATRALSTQKLREPGAFLLKSQVEKIKSPWARIPTELVARTITDPLSFISLAPKLGLKLGRAVMRSELNIGTKAAEKLSRIFSKEVGRKVSPGEARTALVDFITTEKLYSWKGLKTISKKTTEATKSATVSKKAKLGAITKKADKEFMESPEALKIIREDIKVPGDIPGISGLSEAGDLKLTELYESLKNKKMVDVPKVFEDLKTKITRGEIDVSPESRKALLDEVENLKTVYTDPQVTKIGTHGDLKLTDIDDAEELRRLIEKTAYGSKSPNILAHPVKAQAKELSGRGLSDAIHKVEDLKPENLKIRKLKALEEVLGTTIEKADKAPLIGLKDLLLSGGLGALAGGGGAGIAGVVGGLGLRSVLGKGKAASVLLKLKTPSKYVGKKVYGGVVGKQALQTAQSYREALKRQLRGEE